ncbi:MAG: DUF2804 domain-containing protein [Acidobacteriota bacterium]
MSVREADSKAINQFCLLDAPTSQLVDHTGQVALGWFPAPIPEVNLEQATIPYFLSWLRHVPVARGWEDWLRSKLRLKAWQYFSAADSSLLVGVAVANVGYIADAFLYVARWQEGSKYEWNALTPFARGTQVAASSTEGETFFDNRKLRIVMENRADGKTFLLRVNAQGDRRRPALSLNLRLQAVVEPLVVSLPLAGGRYSYTHKLAGLAVEGYLQLDDVRHEFYPQDTFGCLDYSKSYALRHTYWNWACATGRTQEGEAVGFNFVTPTVAGFPENAIWRGGRLNVIEGVRFHFDSTHIMRPWRIESADGSVELEFEPTGTRAQNVRALLVRNRFHQLYGHFHGRLRDSFGKTFTIAKLVGVTEEHDVWW